MKNRPRLGYSDREAADRGRMHVDRSKHKIDITDIPIKQRKFDCLLFHGIIAKNKGGDPPYIWKHESRLTINQAHAYFKDEYTLKAFSELFFYPDGSRPSYNSLSKNLPPKHKKLPAAVTKDLAELQKPT